MIEAKNLTKKYGDKTAVDNLTFTVQSGIVIGFLGPNCDGKSTKMRIMPNIGVTGTIWLVIPLAIGHRLARGEVRGQLSALVNRGWQSAPSINSSWRSHE